jgi:hypothetical protein
MGYEDAGKNAMLDELGTLITHVGLLDETDTEISGGSYTRETISWDAAASGEMDASNEPVFDVPAGNTVSKVIFMSAVSGGTKYAEADVSNEVFTNAGTYTLTSVTLDLNS